MEKHTIHHFSLSLPKGKGQGNVPDLLVHLSEILNGKFPGVTIQDMVFHDELDENGSRWPSVTVYYYK